MCQCSPRGRKACVARTCGEAHSCWSVEVTAGSDGRSVVGRGTIGNRTSGSVKCCSGLRVARTGCDGGVDCDGSARVAICQAEAGSAIIREHCRIWDLRALGRFGVGRFACFQVAEDSGFGVFARTSLPDRTNHQTPDQLVGSISRDRSRDPADDSAAEARFFDALQI